MLRTHKCHQTLGECCLQSPSRHHHHTHCLSPGNSGQGVQHSLQRPLGNSETGAQGGMAHFYPTCHLCSHRRQRRDKDGEREATQARRRVGRRWDHTEVSWLPRTKWLPPAHADTCLILVPEARLLESGFGLYALRNFQFWRESLLLMQFVIYSQKHLGRPRMRDQET